MDKKMSVRDVLVIGFALFAMFFGAGNLIFPPDLGARCGVNWWIGFLFYFIADLGLGIAAVLAMVNHRGDVSKMTAPLGTIPSRIIATLIIICIGPGLAIPRTAATTYELAILPMLGIEADSRSLVIMSVVFFAIVFALSIRPSKVVDIIGSILTPVLLISLLALIAKGFLTPQGVPAAVSTENVVREGIYNGYQTLDMLGAVFFTIIILGSVYGKGYRKQTEAKKMTMRAAFVAAALLFVVYGGLAYLGATTGSNWLDGLMDGSINQAGLLINITGSLLGHSGIILLAIVVSSACLTTAIGLVSAAAEYFEKLFAGRVSYAKLVTIICIFSACVCNLGLSQIISISAPILMILYPVTILMIITSFLQDKVTSNIPYRVTAAVTLAVSIMEVLGGSFGIEAFARIDECLPFADYGFSWLVPAAITFALSTIISAGSISGGSKAPITPLSA